MIFDVLNEADKLSDGLLYFGALAGIGYLLWAPLSHWFYVFFTLLPWIFLLIVVISEGSIQMASPENNLPNLRVPFGFVCVCMGCRALWDWRLVNWTSALVPSLLIALALSLAIVAFDTSARKGEIYITLALFAPIYGYGVAANCNALLDRSEPYTYVARVNGKHISENRGRSPILSLGNWGPRMEPSEEPVKLPFYDSIAPGDKVCIRLRSGAFRMEWYTIDKCGLERKGASR